MKIIALVSVVVLMTALLPSFKCDPGNGCVKIHKNKIKTYCSLPKSKQTYSCNNREGTCRIKVRTNICLITYQLNGKACSITSKPLKDECKINGNCSGQEMKKCLNSTYSFVNGPLKSRSIFKTRVKKLKNLIANIRANKREIKEFVRNCSEVYTNAKEADVDGVDVIRLLENLGQAISTKLGKPLTRRKFGFEVYTSTIAFGIWNVQPNNFNGYTFPEISNQSKSQQQNGLTNQTIILPKSIFNFVHNKSNEFHSSITSISYQPLKTMVSDAEKGGAFIGSVNIIATSITPKLIKKLEKDKGVRINFNIAPFNKSLQPRCVFWKYYEDGNGTWSDEGCYLVENNHEHVQCECNHLTDFSILMTVKDVEYSNGHRVALHYITLVGCIISIIFMAIVILVILCIKKLRKQHRYLIHVNLAISLIVGNCAMLAIDVAASDQVSCLTVSIIMFYFYLAAFFWMLCEGVFIWRSLVTVFTENDRFWAYFLLGWVTPTIVVGVTSLLRRENLISENVCWLSFEDDTILAFVVPALLVIMIDAVVMIVALKITYNQSRKTNRDAEIRTMARATLILLPLLGTTWLLGLFGVNKETIVFKYLFTVFNSLQGFFFFVFYILISKEVHQEIQSYYRIWSSKKKNNARKVSRVTINSSLS